MSYIENWFALGACIYSRKTADAALAALGLRKEIKRKPVIAEIGLVKAKLYFAKYENGRVYCFRGGKTSWTSLGDFYWVYSEDDVLLAERALNECD